MPAEIAIYCSPYNMKLIYIKNKKHYICTGDNCTKCKLRFKCYTERLTLILDWQELHSKYKGSPSMVLRDLVGRGSGGLITTNPSIGNKIFVEGSKKFRELYDLHYSKVIEDKSGVISN